MLDALHVDDVRPRVVTLVSAPPGTGKSTLVAEWFGRERRIPGAWLTLDGRDNEPGRLEGMVAGSLLHAGVLGRLEESAAPARDALLDRVTEQVAALGRPVLMVLDDVHELTRRAAVDALGRLVGQAPPNLRLILISRADPAIALPRLQLDGRLTQIRAFDLAFTAAEAASLFDTHGVVLSPEQLSAALAWTEGWTAALRVAAMALTDHPDPEGFLRDSTATESAVAPTWCRRCWPGRADTTASSCSGRRWSTVSHRSWPCC